MLSPIAFWKSLQGWTERNWPLLSALGFALAFAVMLGGVALAAYMAGFAGPVMSLALGGIAVWLVKQYARGVRAIQRLIDRLHPPAPGQFASPDKVPIWAFLLYTMLFVALMLWVGAPTNIYTVLGWTGGQGVLAYLFWRQNDPVAPSAFAVIDEALDRLAAPHWPLLHAINTVLGFGVLSGGVALHAYNSGFARVAALSLMGSDAAAMQVVIALLCGATAIVFARLYVAITLGAQRALIDPWRYVRPEPPRREIERWPLYIFALVGLMLFFAMSFVGQEQAAGDTSITIEGEWFKLEIGGLGLLALFIGWGGGGYLVLRWFWAKARERTEGAHARA